MRNAATIATGIASLFVCASVAQAQQFDATHCYVGTATVVFASDNATVANFDHKGMYRSNGESKMLHGFSIHCVGTEVIVNKKSTLSGGCKLLDPKGDTISLVFDGSGGAKAAGTAHAVMGTGAWKDISGGGNWQLHTRTKPLSAGAFQNCLRYHGAFTVPR